MLVPKDYIKISYRKIIHLKSKLIFLLEIRKASSFTRSSLCKGRKIETLSVLCALDLQSKWFWSLFSENKDFLGLNVTKYKFLDLV